MDITNVWQARNAASSARHERSVVAVPSERRLSLCFKYTFKLKEPLISESNSSVISTFLKWPPSSGWPERFKQRAFQLRWVGHRPQRNTRLCPPCPPAPCIDARSRCRRAKEGAPRDPQVGAKCYRWRAAGDCVEVGGRAFADRYVSQHVCALLRKLRRRLEHCGWSLCDVVRVHPRPSPDRSASAGRALETSSTSGA